MTRSRLAAVAALALAATLTATGPASAAPPGNDTFSGSTVVGDLPFTDQVDTTEATSDANDDEIAAQCQGVPAYDASVWYQVTPSSDTGLVADVSGADYSAGVFVATGVPAAGHWSRVRSTPWAGRPLPTRPTRSSSSTTRPMERAAEGCSTSPST